MTKPASSAVINPGNALFNAMAACWPMLEGSGTTTADKKGTRTLTFAGGGTAPTWSTNGAGEAMIAIGTALSAPLTPASALNLPGTRSWAIAWRGKETSSNNNGMVLGDNTNTTDFLWMAGGTYLGVRATNSSTPTFTHTSVKDNFTTDADYLLWFEWNSVSALMHLYKNGVEVTGSPQNAGTLTFALNINTIGNGYTSNTFGLVGALTYLYVWDSYNDNGAADAVTLHNDPYVGLTTSPTIYMTPTHGEVSRQVRLAVNGFMTTWTTDTPPIFSLSGGAGASIVSVTVNSDTSATVTLQPGTALGTLTLTEVASGATATFEVVNVFAGGILDTTFAANAALNGSDATGRTFVGMALTQRIRQHGPITQVRASINAVSGSDGFQFKVLRPNGSNFDIVSSSETITPGGTGTQTFDLATPMACQPGDLLGLWIKGSGNGINVKTASLTPSIKYDGGNQTGTNWNPASSVNDYSLDMDYRCSSVTAIATGDSRPAGHNGTTYWYTLYEAGPAGLLAAQPIHQLQALIDATRAIWRYQNFAKGSEKWDFLASDEFPDIFTVLGLTPQFLWTQCGVNDISAGWSNATILAYVDICYAMVPANTVWFIEEVLPWTAGNDTQAAAIRSLNAALIAWAIGKSNVRIVRCHDDMGQLRGITGEIGEMKTANNQDGVHLSVPTGVDALAALEKAAYDAYLATGGPSQFPAGRAGLRSMGGFFQG